MPYKVKKIGKNRWVVVKTTTNEIVAGNKTKLTKEQAIKAMKARYAHSKDAK